MHHKKEIIFLFLLAMGFAFPVLAKQEYLNAKDLSAIKNEPCAFVHLWATWCSICVEEMPRLVKLLDGIQNKVRPVIIDVSTVEVQESESKKWMDGLKPGFTTYLKAAGADATFMESVDPSWSGSLPYSAVFSMGKVKKVWRGSVELTKLKNDLLRLCRKS
jgi:thiol-disulfide isomerase/thioredoxin